MLTNTVPPRLSGYTYVRALGDGATSHVHLYRQHTPERDVAIKFRMLQHNVQETPSFYDEANRMAQLSCHPYILSVFDVGTTDDGVDYIVMEYASGGTYAELMKQRTLDVRQALDLGIKLASALYTAHCAGIVHRDVKPTNILITASGQPALTDFGISASVYEAQTSTGHSPQWAAPEVTNDFSGGSIASDIYSLGATLFALLGGFYQVQQKHNADVNVDADALGGTSGFSDSMAPDGLIFRRSIPNQVKQTLMKALNINPDERYHSALEFARAMQQTQIVTSGHMTPVTAPDTSEYPDMDSRVVVSPDSSTSPTRQADRESRVLPTPGKSVARDDSAIQTTSTRHIPSLSGTATVIAVIVAMAVILIVIAVFVMAGMDSVSLATPAIAGTSYNNDLSADSERTQSLASTPSVPSPEHLVGSVDGDTVTFTWLNPYPQDGDRYVWQIIDNTLIESHNGVSHQESLTLPHTENAPLCLSVSIIRADRSMSSEPAVTCVTE